MQRISQESGNLEVTGQTELDIISELWNMAMKSQIQVPKKEHN